MSREREKVKITNVNYDKKEKENLSPLIDGSLRILLLININILFIILKGEKRKEKDVEKIVSFMMFLLHNLKRK